MDVWYKFLASVRSNAGEIEVLGEAQLAEATEMLREILKTRESYLGENHIATGEARYTIGLLYLFCGETDTAQRQISSAANIYKEHLGDDHPSTIDVEEVLNQLNDATLFANDELKSNEDIKNETKVTDESFNSNTIASETAS